MTSIVQELGRFDQVLRRQATPVDAGAADDSLLRHHGSFAQFLRCQCRSKGRRTGAKDNEIIIIFIHISFSL
ncbi:MAG: hypothetical protein CME33_26695 [Gimesia sp.]|nr:hypothetical protein [Gimesia sp.]|tara:strand:+ start:2074 stop:2289 length:216 start_codon:yes stop_codon:yes gene_type:complete